jgi:hypothetical protein
MTNVLGLMNQNYFVQNFDEVYERFKKIAEDFGDDELKYFKLGDAVIIYISNETLEEVRLAIEKYLKKMLVENAKKIQKEKRKMKELQRKINKLNNVL